MKSSIYDVDSTIIVVGSCLKDMQPEGYGKLEDISDNIYELCLEQTHINMAITKIGAMLRTNKIKRLIFASVDRSPHCTSLHYIQDELRKMMQLSDITIDNYVVVDNELIKIEHKVVLLSKNLGELSKLVGENGQPT